LFKRYDIFCKVAVKGDSPRLEPFFAGTVTTKNVAQFTVSYYLLIVLAQQILFRNFCQPATHCPNQMKIKMDL